MNVNYTIDHRLLDTEPIKKLKGNAKFVTWHIMSMIIHFTNTVGSCKVPKSQLSKDFGISKRFFGDATKLLIELDWIKELVPYDRATQSAAVYTTSTGYINLGLKLYTPGTKAVSTRNQEKEFPKEFQKGKKAVASFDDAPSFSLEEPDWTSIHV